LNKTGGYFLLDGAYSLDFLEKKLYNWKNGRKVGNIVIFCSAGQFVGIQEETTTKDI